ncbi:MAG: hypothetical protein AAFU65_01160 [Pseudomonadota bacterium]
MHLSSIVMVLLAGVITPPASAQPPAFNYTDWVYEEALRREKLEFVWPTGTDVTSSRTRSRSEMGGTDPQDQKEHFWYDGQPVPDTPEYRVRPNGSLYTSKALVYLALMAHQGIDESRSVRLLSQTNSLASSPTTWTPAERVLAHVRDLLTPGNAPTLRGTGHAGHTDGSMAVALAFVRDTPAVWNALTAAQRDKLDWIMRGYAAAGNFAQNFDAANDDNSGLLGWGSYTKVANPNLQEGYVSVMIAAYYYFGHGLGSPQEKAAAVNAELAAFDFDTYVQAFDDHGLVNAHNAWQWAVLPRAQKEAYFSGGALGGTDDRTPAMINQNVRRPFTYRAVYPRIGDVLHRPDDPFTTRLMDTPTQTDGGASIAYDPVDLYFALSLRQFYHVAEDESRVPGANPDERGYTLGSAFDPDNPGANQTPVNGAVGMGFEFRARPERHSLKYVLEGLMLNVFTGALIEQMRDFDRMADSDRRAMFERMQIGWADFLYKAEVGYRSFEGDKGNPVTGLNYGHQIVERGFNLVEDAWLGYLRQVATAYTTAASPGVGVVQQPGTGVATGRRGRPLSVP